MRHHPGPVTPQVPTHPIPLQIPRTALAAFDSLGITPVPPDQSDPNAPIRTPVVLVGARDNGNTLDITINLSLLDSAQLSGLAAVLNLLKTNGVNLQAPRASSSTSNEAQSGPNSQNLPHDFPHVATPNLQGPLELQRRGSGISGSNT